MTFERGDSPIDDDHADGHGHWVRKNVKGDFHGIRAEQGLAFQGPERGNRPEIRS